MNREPIAIVGIGCRFPNAKNPEAFWHLLCNGVDAITQMPASRWDIDPDTTMQEKTNTHWGGFLEQIDLFDPKFFSISPREAASMDPQQRLLLEITWEALEDAGQIPERLFGTQTGVFIGISAQDFSVLTWANSSADVYTTTGTSHSIAANRISYVFNFTGPSIAFNTACSSSLVAVHYACQSLWNEDSTLAVAGGVNVLLSPKATDSLAKAGLIAADGRCKTFDARANGYVRGEGAGVVILKPLSQAQADGDSIYAVIKGSAINQDGRSNGLTAPNLQAQEAVLRSAYRLSGVSPSQVQYIEANGTGTSLGDSIEMKALGKVLAQERLPGDYCAVGSVKTNIGNLEAAGGIAGLIKVALSLKHGKIPPNLHFQKPNPYIPFDKLPLRVQQTLEPWPQRNGSAIAGVSSFGFGGTNAHVVLAQTPLEIQNSKVKSQKKEAIERPVRLLTLSAKSEKALQELAQHYQEFLLNHPDVSLADVCFSANTTRSHFNHRLAVVAESKVQLQHALGAFTAEREIATVVSGRVEGKKRPKVAFLFTGLGSQYVGMGRQLYETAPSFRQTLNRCDEILRPYLGTSLLTVLYPEPGTTSPLDQTAYTEPVLFAIEYALFELWKSWGIVPTAVMGHSVGEYVAATVAGVFSLEDGLKLIAERSRLMQNLSSTGEAEFHQVATTVSYAAPQIDIISNVTGQQLTSNDITPEYWCRHLKQPVRFATSLQTLHSCGYEIFVEIGSNSTLLRVRRNCLPAGEGLWFPSLRPESSDWQQLLQSLSILYVHGQTVNWSGFYQDNSQQKLSLPTYPFDRQHYWIEISQERQTNPLVKGHNEELKLQPNHSQDLNQFSVDQAPKLIEQEEVVLNQILAMSSDQRVKYLISYLQKQIANILQIDDQQEISVKSDLFTLEIDSIIIMELINYLQHDFHIKINPREVYNRTNILDVAKYVAAEFEQVHGRSTIEVQLNLLNSPTSTLPEAKIFQNPPLAADIFHQSSLSLSKSCLVEIQTGGSQRPFFCVPGADGSVFCLYELAHYLGSDQPFYGLQKLDIDSEWEPHIICKHLASHYIQAIQRVQPQGPYLLGGHCFGGKVAFEMAQQLQQQGHQVALLALLDTSAPRYIKPIEFGWDYPTWLNYSLHTFEVDHRTSLDIPYEDLSLLDPDEKLYYYAKQLLNSDRLLPIHKDLLQIGIQKPGKAGVMNLHYMFKVIIANDLSFYEPQKVYLTRNVLFRASDYDPQTAFRAKGEFAEILQDSAWGWNKFSVEPVKVYMVPGDHFTMMSKPHVQVLAEQLRTCIKQAQADEIEATL
ncbi:beta-ketoacyl synthase N-terminal-like domain-containing protein [Nostoc sp.]|uniref:beta-ketoacyl synthase N-terminal-like domain-containing protein n=1 Tax=Nostoc sp. TaxID=1180 RepID=UPI002FF64064